MKKGNELDIELGYWLDKEDNNLCMSRKEFEDKKEKHKYWNKPYEYYRVFPILNRGSQQKLIVFIRTNNNPVDIIKECARLLEEENELKEKNN